MKIQFRTDVPPVEDFRNLFLTTGWNNEYHLSPVEIAHALCTSWFVVTAYDEDELIGFGRIVSDGVLHAMIYDLIVAPAYQGKGIGSQILDRLIARCREARIRDIQLFCVRGKREYYEKRGFTARPDDAPGMQLLNSYNSDK